MNSWGLSPSVHALGEHRLTQTNSGRRSPNIRGTGAKRYESGNSNSRALIVFRRTKSGLTRLFCTGIGAHKCKTPGHVLQNHLRKSGNLGSRAPLVSLRVESGLARFFSTAEKLSSSAGFVSIPSPLFGSFAAFPWQNYFSAKSDSRKIFLNEYIKCYE